MATLKLASDVDNPDFVGARNPDDTLWVRFESRKHLHQFKSEQAGHPVYEMVDFVTIQAPGDQLNVIERIATDKDKARFPRQWAHFMNTKTSGVVDGWAIEEWPLVNAAQAEELKYRKFFTVEQLAEAPDNVVQSLGMGYMELKQKAIIAVRNARDNSLVHKQAAELKKRDEQLAAMQEQINSLLAAQKAGKPGRPAKAERAE